jgi:hypothetical protein
MASFCLSGRLWWADRPTFACVIRITISIGDQDSSLIFLGRRYPGRNRLGIDRNRVATSGVAWPASTSASGFRRVRWRLLARCCDPKRSDPSDLVSRSTTNCTDRTVRARWYPESYGISEHCITSRSSLQKRKTVGRRASADLWTTNRPDARLAKRLTKKSEEELVRGNQTGGAGVTVSQASA